MGHICVSVSVGNCHLHRQGRGCLVRQLYLVFFKFHVALPLIAGKINALAKVLVTVGGTRSCLTLVKGKGKRVHVLANLPQNSPWWIHDFVQRVVILLPDCGFLRLGVQDADMSRNMPGKVKVAAPNLHKRWRVVLQADHLPQSAVQCCAARVVSATWWHAVTVWWPPVLPLAHREIPALVVNVSSWLFSACLDLFVCSLLPHTLFFTFRVGFFVCLFRDLRICLLAGAHADREVQNKCIDSMQRQLLHQT